MTRYTNNDQSPQKQTHPGNCLPLSALQNSSGIQRTLKFCTYLREYGWDPLILTISPAAYETTSADQMREIPDDVVVERAFGLRHLSPSCHRRQVLPLDGSTGPLDKLVARSSVDGHAHDQALPTCGHNVYISDCDSAPYWT
jgi:hypothetical protein